MTNYEKLRQMTPEEMAKSNALCPASADGEICVRGNNANCEQCVYDSRFVELPCKVGDTVWFILTDLDDISLKDYTVTAGRCAINDGDIVTEIGTSGFWYQAIYDDGRTKTFNPSNDDFCEWDELGKTVFLTREEAEQALKESENNAN